MARRNHSGGDSRRVVPEHISLRSASPRRNAGGPGFVFAAGSSVSSEFPKPGVPNKAAEEANTSESSVYSFSVGVSDSGDRFPKPASGKKSLHGNRTASGFCKQSQSSSHSRSKNVSRKKSSKYASDWKNSLDSAMRNLSMNDKGNNSAAKDEGNVFVFRGKGKENVSASANGECHPFDSVKESASNVSPSKTSDFGVFTFNAKFASSNVRDDTLYGADSSNKSSSHENCNQKRYTGSDWNNNNFAEGVPEFRIGKSSSKTNKARHRIRRKQKNSSTQEETQDKNHSKNDVESPSYSPMEYSPCEKAFAQSSGDFSVDQKASFEAVFAVGTSDHVTEKASVTRRFRRKKMKKTAHFGGLSQAKSNNHKEVLEEESGSKNGNNSGEKLDFVDACEEWCDRGNEALKNGDVLKAEEFYTKGINEAASCKASECIVICYSDRAAARFSLGKIREAINDCVSATSLDPKCTKANLTAANCYLLMGEANKSLKHYKKCLEKAGEVCLDRRTAIEAANGLHQSQKLAKLIESAGNIFETISPDSAQNGFEAVEKALVTSPYSEELLALKAWSLLLLTRYEEAIDLCENTLHSALKNFFKSPELEDSSCKIWRCFIKAKCYFFMGSLEKSHSLLEKILKLNPRDLSLRVLKTDMQSISSFAFAVRDLISQKSAGNEAYKSGRYSAAIEHYSSALSANVQSRPFAAICFCNRAAAYQAAGQIIDAIADCSLAIALDANYTKALSRRSMLFELIQDFEQAAADQRRLIPLIHSRAELKQAQRRLSLLDDLSKNETSMDLYLILGVRKLDPAIDVKKAYRKAALRHHPDKACQNLTRCESNHEAAIWGGILKEVHVDADRLFKVIGEAYSVLSDPSKKEQYDLDEEKRKSKDGKHKESPKQQSTRRWSNHQDKWTREDNFYSRGRAC